MVYIIPSSIRKLWNEWNIRAVILFSLSLQIFLILAALLRKCTSIKTINCLIWMAYLLANWAAIFVVGHISSQQNNDAKSGSNGHEQASEILQAFWASFLLVHLGCSDTITTFALEDNELWPRHLFGLVTQVRLISNSYIRALLF